MQVTFFTTNDQQSKELPIYLTSIGYDYEELYVDRPYGYDDFQWIQTIEGSGTLYIDQKKYTLIPGQGMFLYPNKAHKYEAKVNGEWITEWLSFSGRDIAQLVNAIGFHSSGVFDIHDTQHIGQLIREIYNLSVSSNPYKHLDTSNLLYSFLVQLYKGTTSLHHTSTANYYTRLAPVIAYLDNHINEPMELSSLAGMIDVSPQYLCTLFKKVTGSRPALYVNHLKLNKAKEMMLLYPNKTIAAIAKDVGFESPSYFSALFKKYENQTPQQFIALHRS